MEKFRQYTSEKKGILLLDLTAERDPVLRHSLIDFDFNILKRLYSVDEFDAALKSYDADLLVIQVEQPTAELLRCLAEASKLNPKPIVLFSEKSNGQIVDDVVNAGVSAYIVDKIHPERIKNIIDIALARHQSYKAMLQELNETKSKLAERKILDKAKGMLMKHKNISEDEAFGILRKMAMDKGQKIAVIAQQVIDTISILEN